MAMPRISELFEERLSEAIMGQAGYHNHTLQAPRSHRAYAPRASFWDRFRPAHHHVPTHLLIKPVSLWPCQSQAGQWLCAQNYLKEGLPENFWSGPADEIFWLSYLHSFDWLAEMRSIGGDHARHMACLMLESWLYLPNRSKRLDIEPAILASRLMNWLNAYEFFEPSLTLETQELFFEMLGAQARLLHKRCAHKSRMDVAHLEPMDRLHCAKALICSGLALERMEHLLEAGIAILSTELSAQILPDGMHVSKSPKLLLRVVMDCLEIRHALKLAAYPQPSALTRAIDKAVPALRFFTYVDKGLALFHGTSEGNRDILNAVFTQANVRARPVQELSSSGFAKISMGRTSLIMDTGAMPPYPHDQVVHAAPLAFELCHGRERIFVSCGSHDHCQEWRSALRATAAHSAAIIDGRDACTFHASGHMERSVLAHSSYIERTCGGVSVEASHDGYRKINGIVHRRKIDLSMDGYYVHGTDTFCSGLQSGGAGLMAHHYAARFHLHPSVRVSMAQDGGSVLLRTPNGIGWRFRGNCGSLSIEDSVYLGNGHEPRKTSQILIMQESDASPHVMEWFLTREGV